MSDLFNWLEKTETEEQDRVAGTRAAIAARARISSTHQSYLSRSADRDEYEARLELMRETVREVCSSVADTYHSDPDVVFENVLSQLKSACESCGCSAETCKEGKCSCDNCASCSKKTAGGHPAGCECGFCKNKGKLPGASTEEEDEEPDGDADDADPAEKSAKSHDASLDAHTAADTETGDTYTQERVSLPKAGPSGLSDVGSPKIDKGPSGTNRGWTLKSIDPESEANPTTQQNASDKADFDDPTKPEDMTKHPVKRVDAQKPMQPEHNVAPHTKTFGEGNQADPVTRKSLSKWSIE